MSVETGIAAFFDLDGTLVAPPSLECRFLTHLAARGLITGSGAVRWMWYGAKRLLFEPRAAIDANKFYLAGLRKSLASEWAESIAEEGISFFGRGLERVAWHIGQRHRVVLVSGTLAPLAWGIARRLGRDVDVIATEIEVCGGCWTGRISGGHVSGDEKARALTAYAQRNGARLEWSYAYGNEISDLAMLEAVGHATAVNPGSRLERVARLRGWPVCKWKAQASLSLRAYPHRPAAL